MEAIRRLLAIVYSSQVGRDGKDLLEAYSPELRPGLAF